MKEEDTTLEKLHFTEAKLIKLIREKQNGKIFVSIKDGLPMSGFISNRQAVVFNHEDCKENE